METLGKDGGGHSHQAWTAGDNCSWRMSKSCSRDHKLVVRVHATAVIPADLWETARDVLRAVAALALLAACNSPEGAPVESVSLAEEAIS
jgi:hypothetical protein